MSRAGRCGSSEFRARRWASHVIKFMGTAGAGAGDRRLRAKRLIEVLPERDEIVRSDERSLSSWLIWGGTSTKPFVDSACRTAAILQHPLGFHFSRLPEEEKKLATRIANLSLER